ncbi:MAG: choice-of-anchor D domain-containing protein [Candidatus Marithrix sp.]
MIKRIIASILNIIMIIPVYAALSVNPVNLPVSNLESGTYTIEFDALTTEHSIKYCLDITIAQDFYYEIILDGGITWGRNINPAAIENATLINDGRQDSNTATFFIQTNSEPMLLGTCLNLETELVINIPPAPLSTKFTITTIIKDPMLGVNLNTPQTKNLIILTTSCDKITEIPQAECEILVELYNNTYGNNWTDSYNNNWNLTNTPCSWDGVRCINEHVIVIERQAKNLTGSLPDLSVLTELQTLDLKGNKLAGYIPSMNSLTKLQVLILSGGNQIIGRIPKLDTLVNLQWIDLANNQLTGNIPDLENLNSLRHLNLANNKLEGSIPTSLKNLNNLELLKLNNNRINANIPDLSNLIKLQTIWLQNNQLEANIPSIDSLINLTDLDLGYNKLMADTISQKVITSRDSDWADTQTIFPTNIIATAKSTTSIEINWTAINYIADTGFYQINYSITSGNYNTAINTNSKTDTSLIIDDLSPATTYYFTITTVTKPHGQQQSELNSTSEEFTVTTLPKITNIVPEITVVDIDANTIVDGDRIIFENIILNSEFSKIFTIINNGDISVNLSQLEITGNDIFKIKKYFEPVIVTIEKNESTTFSISLDTSETGIFTGEILFHFSNEDNPYNFFITSEIIIDEVDATDCTVQSNILKIECQTLLILYETTDGNSWNENANWNKTNNPCDWVGITCATTGNYVTAIELPSNNLVGTIPDLSSLKNLQKLDLSFNQLTGNIPISLSSLINLTSLNLDYNKLTSQTEPNLSALLSSFNPDWNITQTVPPNNIRISTISPTTVSLQWTAITYQFATGNYSVKYETTSGGPYGNVKKIMVVNNEPESNYAEKVDNLLPDTDYYFVVETNTSSNGHVSNSEPSLEVLATTLPNIFSTPEPDTLLDIGSSELGTPSTVVNITILQPEIEITDISIAADETNDFTVSNNFNILTVQCIPSEIGTREGILKISYLVDKAIKTAQYFLTCTGKSTLNYTSDPEPNSTLIMSSIIATPTATSIEISNAGNTTLAITEIIVTNNEVFKIDSTPFLVNDEAYLLRIQCIPVQEGKYSATLTLITNLSKPITYELECIGIRNIVEPIYNSIPKPDGILQIGNIILDTAITKSIMISNQGGGTLTIETSTITGDTSFSIVSGEAPVAIINTTHNLEIQCIPKQTGNHTAILTLTIANQKPVSYILECVGITKQTVIYSSEPKPNSIIEIGNTTVESPIITTINIAEMGNETLNVISNSIDSSTKKVFAIIDGMAPFSIVDGGNEHLLVVQCTPVEITKYTAQLILQTNDPIRNLVKYDLTCTGIEGFSVTGEIRVKSGRSGTDISIDSPEIFSLIGWIKPFPKHIGQLVDIIVNYHWKAFDNNSSLTIPVKINSQVQLPKELEIILFEGSLINMAGSFEVEFGYQTNDHENFIGKIAQLEIKPNRPPTVIELDIKIDNKLIGIFNTIDSDNADRFIYGLTNSNRYFRIIGNELYVTNLMPRFKDIKLVNNESFDNIYPIEVQTTDISGAYITEQFIIQVIPIINPPVINLTKQSVLENYQGIVGRIWTDGFEFKLLENENFSLDDKGILRTKRPLDFETNPSHNITIQGIKEKIFTIDVINVPDIDVHGKIINNITDFIKISANDLETVTIQFIPDITHRNQEADILAVAAYTINQQTRFLVRNDDTWQTWDRFTLPEFTHLVLEDEHEVALFDAAQFTAGELQVYIGYRLDNKELIYNPNPITIEINN